MPSSFASLQGVRYSTRGGSIDTDLHFCISDIHQDSGFNYCAPLARFLQLFLAISKRFICTLNFDIVYKGGIGLNNA